MAFQASGTTVSREYTPAELDAIIAAELQARRREPVPVPRRDWDRRLKPRKPLNPSKCLGCDKPHPNLRPIYGKELPGACPACWQATRRKALEFVVAWRMQLAFEGGFDVATPAAAVGGAGA